MLHLVYNRMPTIPVRFVRWKGETEHINNFNAVIEQTIDRYPALSLTQIELNRISLNDKVEERKHLGTEDYDSYFIGLRAEESTVRRITLKTHGKFYKNKSGLTRISPLADWKTKNIAAYISEYQLPTLLSYSRDGIASRTASRVPRADHGIRAAFLQNLRQNNPQAYNNIVAKFPEIEA